MQITLKLWNMDLKTTATLFAKGLELRVVVCLCGALGVCVSLLCAEGACCPGRIQRALAGSAQRAEGQGWGPSYYERSLARDQGWGPAWPQGRGPDQGKDLGEGCLPWGDLVSTSPWISCSRMSSRDLKEKKEMAERRWEGVTARRKFAKCGNALCKGYRCKYALI